MKNSLKYKQEGALTIIDRFDELPIDGKMTEIANREAISKFPESAQIIEKMNIKKGHHVKAKAAKKVIRLGKQRIADGQTLLKMTDNDKEKELINIRIAGAQKVIEDEIKKESTFLKAADSVDPELNQLNRVHREKTKDLIRSNPIYCHPRKNEIALPDAKFNELKALFKSLNNQQISLVIEMEDLVVIDEVGKEPIKAPFAKLVSHELIDDYRGNQYFYNDGQWVASEVITQLGVTKSTVVPDEYEAEAIESKDLTDEQREEIRLQGLTGDQKTTEKESAIQSALSQAAQMKTELEIQGSTAAKALTDSKAWYNEQVALIEAKYG